MHTLFFKLVRRWFGATSCPTEQQLAAYVDRQLIGEERHTVEHHLVNCQACVEQIAYLTRSAPSEELEIPAELLHEAIAFGRPAASRQIPSWALVTAGATAVVLLALTTIQLPRQREVAALSAPTGAPSLKEQSKAPIDDAGSTVQVRGSKDQKSPIIYPVENQKVDTDNLVFRWLPSDQAESYRIELLTDAGTLIWSTRVSSLQVALPRTIHLAPRRTYYLRLLIHQKTGTTEHTKAVGFVAG